MVARTCVRTYVKVPLCSFASVILNGIWYFILHTISILLLSAYTSPNHTVASTPVLFASKIVILSSSLSESVEFTKETYAPDNVRIADLLLIVMLLELA